MIINSQETKNVCLTVSRLTSIAPVAICVTLLDCGVVAKQIYMY